MASYIQLGAWGRYKLPQRSAGAEPQPKSISVQFSLKIWHLVATILMIYLRINQCWIVNYNDNYN